jgi:hypothetical protein
MLNYYHLVDALSSSSRNLMMNHCHRGPVAGFIMASCCACVSGHWVVQTDEIDFVVTCCSLEAHMFILRKCWIAETSSFLYIRS